MSSIVIDLQDEILSSDCDIVQILRRAHVIAVKLGLKEFDQWISYELNGYPDQNACPDYRKVRVLICSPVEDKELEKSSIGELSCPGEVITVQKKS